MDNQEQDRKKVRDVAHQLDRINDLMVRGASLYDVRDELYLAKHALRVLYNEAELRFPVPREGSR